MAKIHTIDGVQYREVARDAKVGDFLLFEEAPYSFLTSGKVYKVTGIDSYGDPEIIDDEGDKILIEEEYVVLEQVGAADLFALESELAAMKAKVAEMEAQLAEAVAAQQKAGAPEEEERLKVGDYAKVVKPTVGFSAKGQIVKITKVDDSDIPYNTQGMDGKYTGWYEATDLVRATDEEVAEAKRKLEEKRRLHELEAKWHAIGRKVGEFKVGDVVKTLQEVGGHPVGTIGVLAKWEPDHSHLIEANGETYFHAELALVAPVESIVNLRGGDAV